MKFLTEYRDPDLAQRYLNEIQKTVTRPWTIMEVCGGQTHSLVKNGILNMLPKEINMVHGPGCPVCVTPLNLIDKAVYLAEEFLENTTEPYYDGEVDYGDRAEHCWNGDHTRGNGLSRLRYHQMFIPKWTKWVQKNAPKGADLRSWRY